MNTDIRISTDFFLHPKTEMLEKRLGPKGVLCLIKLWIWAAQTRPDGVFGKKTCEYVAAAAKWKGDCHKFVDALIELELLDQDEDGVLSLHNWCKRQPYAIKSDERVERARKAAAARWGNSNDASSSNENANKQDAPDNYPEQKENISASNACSMPDAYSQNANACPKNANSNAKAMLNDANGMPPTQPNQTEVLRTSDQDPPSPPTGGDTAQAQEETAEGNETASPEEVTLSPEQPSKSKRKRTDYRRKDFEEWFAEYGAKVDEERVWKQWQKKIRENKLPEQSVLMAALAKYKQSKVWRDGYAKKPDNYLRGCYWNDEFSPAQPQRQFSQAQQYGPQRPYEHPKTAHEKTVNTAAGFARVLSSRMNGGNPPPNMTPTPSSMLDIQPQTVLPQGEVI